MRTNERVAAIYVRISSDREGRELGVQRQEEDCRALAERLDLTVGRVFRENDTGASSRSRKPRPEYAAMIQAVERGEFGVILAYSNSRLTRRLRELEDIIRLHEGTGVLLMTVVSGNDDLSTADGRMVARIKASVDSAEAERIGERVSRAARQRAEHGQWHGGTNPPFGYELTDSPDGRGKTLQPHPEYAPMLREAATRILSGESLYGICSDWNLRGLTTSRGAHWRSKTLRNALISPAAIGKRATQDGGMYPATWEPLLDGVTWDRLRDVLLDPSRRFQPQTGYGVKHALGGGLTLCGVCGKKLISQRHRDQDRLICHKQATGGCGTVTVNYAHLEEFVLPFVWDALDTEEVRASLNRPTDDSDEDVRLRAELREIDRLKDRNYDAFQDGIVDKDRYLRRERELDDRRDRVQDRLMHVMANATAAVVPSLAAARERWDRGDVPWRRAFLSALIRSVTVSRHPAGVATTMTRFSRRGETDEEFTTRVREHRARIMRERIEINWRV